MYSNDIEEETFQPLDKMPYELRDLSVYTRLKCNKFLKQPQSAFRNLNFFSANFIL